MKMGHPIASQLMIAAFLAGCATTVLAQSAPVPTTKTLPPSSIANPADAGVRAHTNVQILGLGAISGTPQASGPPYLGYFYETPASIACIYGLQISEAGCNPQKVSSNPQGGSGAIAIVDAYDDPNASEDLQGFSTQFGVAAPPSFQVVYAPFGGSTPGSCKTAWPGPQPSSAKGMGWDIEESLDIEWAHAMAPSAALYLVEAQSNGDADLFCAVSVASALVAAAGGGEVSMSWGEGEFTTQTAVDPLFTTPKVVYFAAAGDGPGVLYPGASPNVVSVGGTTLRTNDMTGEFEVEITWADTGGGASGVEPMPSYQTGIVPGNQRGTPDVVADANPCTGVWVYDSLTDPPYVWWLIGGTSLATPMWAGIVNATGDFAASTQAELTKLYMGAHEPYGFTDITSGICGPYMSNVATVGWDFCSGLGSPKKLNGDTTFHPL